MMSTVASATPAATSCWHSTVSCCCASLSANGFELAQPRALFDGTVGNQLAQLIEAPHQGSEGIGPLIGRRFSAKTPRVSIRHRAVAICQPLAVGYRRFISHTGIML